MRFLSKIRERQFAKKWGGTYNLSRAVLAGVLAAGCLMPGFAEAAVLKTDPDYHTTSNWDLEHTQNEDTVTIKGITKDGLDPDGTIEIFWASNNEEAIVEGCTINVKDVNTPSTQDIIIKGGYVDNGKAISNTVNISNVTFENSAEIYGGASGSVGSASFSGNTRSNGTVTGNTVTGNTVTIKDTTFKDYAAILGGYTSGDGTVTGNKVTISGNTTFNEANEASEIYGG